MTSFCFSGMFKKAAGNRLKAELFRKMDKYSKITKKSHEFASVRSFIPEEASTVYQTARLSDESQECVSTCSCIPEEANTYQTARNRMDPMSISLSAVVSQKRLVYQTARLIEIGWIP
jgi:hypothetical protein